MNDMGLGQPSAVAVAATGRGRDGAPRFGRILVPTVGGVLGVLFGVAASRKVTAPLDRQP